MSEQDDLKHVDTVSTAQSPDTGAGLGDAGREEGPISARVGYDPSNLGDEVADASDATAPNPEAEIPDDRGGDLIHPSPINEPLGKAPGM